MLDPEFEVTLAHDRVDPEGRLITFLVSSVDIHVLTTAHGREGAKRNAARTIQGNPDNWTVTPLTKPGERVTIDWPVRP